MPVLPLFAAAVIAVLPQDTTRGTATVRVRVTHAASVVSGAIVRSGPVGTQTNAAGTAVLRLAAGRHDIVTSRLVFAPDTVGLTLTAGQDTAVTVELEEQAAEIESVVIASTRTSRRVED